MVDIYIGGRCSYKTTMCINYLKDHPDTVAFVAHSSMVKLYPVEVRNRVYVITENNVYGKTYKKVIIDELDCYKDFDIINALLYSLESQNALVFVTATPVLSYNKLNTPLRNLIRRNNGYKMLPPTFNNETLNILKNYMSEEIFWRESFGYMKSDAELNKLESINNTVKQLKNELDRIHSTITSVRPSVAVVERITDEMLNE